ncbi:hypothetical protein EDC55_10834 [Allofrancisella inopinata]|uniref:Uncharacterized protein n=1 Tax=Allofrancisella inopinata TaxID=1085647 RepID=A0AAE7CQB0_9GAMM|nr:hypothetical protein [Allofrancisella inopinata]QIV95685.1 hypothetical protein E4K63_02095 [Allofrancisella inopinata]TDT72141.1 hypothetical protein EDC55_10834 [Allofrancisella inopinata]
MVDSNELLAIGTALVKTVRKYIKYSENIDSLYSGYKKNGFYISRLYKFRELRSLSPSTPEEEGRVSLELGVGYCGELSFACLYIAQGLKKIKVNTFYLSFMNTAEHAFILAHTSLKLFNSTSSPEWVYYKDNFHELSIDPELSNAVIIDPWIYKATKLSNYLEHLEHAELFQVGDFYDSVIMYGSVHVTISPKSKITNINEDYINTFEFFYKEQKQKLDNKRESFARGRRFRSVRESLEYNIQQYQLTKSFEWQVEEARELKKVVETCKRKVLEILEKYLKTDPNKGKMSLKALLYLNGRHHIDRSKLVLKAIDGSQNIVDMLDILNKEKKAFEVADVKYSGKAKIDERWTKDPGQIKNRPKDLEKSKYYQTICEAIRIASIYFSVALQ